jgi:hypothetical protein
MRVQADRDDLPDLRSASGFMFRIVVFFGITDAEDW